VVSQKQIQEKVPFIALDLETAPSLNPWDKNSRIRMVVISDRVGRAFIIQATPDSRLPEWLVQLIESPNVGLTGANLKFDLVWLKRFGLRPAGPWWDLSSAEHILAADSTLVDLKSLTLKYLPRLGDYARPFRQLLRERGGWANVADAEFYEYAGADGEASIAAHLAQVGVIEERGLERPLRLYQDLYRVLVEMEHSGCAVDLSANLDLDARYQTKLQTLRAEISETLGPINPNSPGQLAGALLATIPTLNLTKRKLMRIVGTNEDLEVSTERRVLEREASKHEILGKILEYRRYRVRHSTFIAKLRERHFVEHSGGTYLHPNFNTSRVETYRLSSSSPNGQNIPRVDDAGPEYSIKRQFISRFDGGWILEGDLSQAEIRFAAWVSGDPVLQASVEAGDVHTTMASRIFRRPEVDVTPEERQYTKSLTFLILYQGGSYALSQTLGITKPEAQKLIDDFYRAYPVLRGYVNDTFSRVQETLEVETPFGFRRRFSRPYRWTHPKYDGPSKEAARIYRQAFNTIIQNGAACLTYCAMIYLHNRLCEGNYRSKIILQVHDSIVLDIHPEERAIIISIVEEAMTTGAVATAKEYGVVFDVPLKCDLKIGPNWAETQEV